MVQRIKNKLIRLSGIGKIGNTKSCYICKNTLLFFLPFTDEVTSCFAKELQIIGSDIKNFSCPHCFSHDRERHLFMYIDALSLWEPLKGRVLHFAPEMHLSKKIKEMQPEKYIKADLYSDDINVEKIDITAIPYPDKHFDFLICNHVLEHIEDLDSAISEIYRVLDKGAMAILQTPYSEILSTTFEDKNINSNQLRQQFYGQDDHVRVFGSDFFEKLEAKGFILKVEHHQDVLKEIDSVKYGVNVKENFILVQK